jgi:hypothetical protein
MALASMNVGYRFVHLWFLTINREVESTRLRVTSQLNGQEVRKNGIESLLDALTGTGQDGRRGSLALAGRPAARQLLSYVDAYHGDRTPLHPGHMEPYQPHPLQVHARAPADVGIGVGQPCRHHGLVDVWHGDHGYAPAVSEALAQRLGAFAPMVLRRRDGGCDDFQDLERGAGVGWLGQ